MNQFTLTKFINSHAQIWDLRGIAHILGVFIEAERHKLFEGFGVGSLEVWRIALRNEEQYSHGVKVCMGRFAVGQLDSCDTQ